MLCVRELNDKIECLENEILEMKVAHQEQIDDIYKKFKKLDLHCEYHNKRNKSGIINMSKKNQN